MGQTFSAGSLGSPFAHPPGDDEVHLRLLGLTDLHMNLHGYDYFRDRQTDSGGLARAAGMIATLRKATANTLLFDNGDLLQGNPMGDVLSAAPADDAPHPMIAALNLLGVDAATLGNHDFNYGLAYLQGALRDASYPVVSANIFRADTAGETWLPPFVVQDRTVTDGSGQAHPLRIGVIGFAPPQITAWDRKHLEGRLITHDIVETAQAMLPRLRNAGADLVVALSHSGIGASTPYPGMENASAALAALPGIDVVFAGHNHRVFPSPDYRDHPGADLDRGLLHGTPTTMAGDAALHVGVVDLMLTRRGRSWHIATARAASPAVQDHAAPPDPTGDRILAASRQAHDTTRARMGRPVGQSAIPLRSYFGMLEPASAIRFVATAQAWHAREALKDTGSATLPLLSAVAPFRLGGPGGADRFTDIPAGDVTLRDVAALYEFPNAFRVLRLDGAMLRDWLDHAAGIFRQITPGQPDQPLLDPDFPSYNFDTITGLTYRIDLTAPPRFTTQGAPRHPDTTRIRDLAHNGSPVRDTDTFLIVTNDYRASRLGTYPGADDAALVLSTPEAHRDILTRFLQETAPDRDLHSAPWTLTAPKGTSVTFQTGPGAMAEAHRFDTMGLEPLATMTPGFLTFRKTF